MVSFQKTSSQQGGFVNLLGLICVAILLIILPFAVKSVQQKQEIRKMAVYPEEITPTPFANINKYRCDNGNCVLDINGSFDSLNLCKANCEPIPTPTLEITPTLTTSPTPTLTITHYSCSPTGNCVVDNNGPFSSLNLCKANCEPQPTPTSVIKPTPTSTITRYSCDTRGNCVVDNNGPFSSLNLCKANCEPQPTPTSVIKPTPTTSPWEGLVGKAGGSLNSGVSPTPKIHPTPTISSLWEGVIGRAGGSLTTPTPKLTPSPQISPKPTITASPIGENVIANVGSSLTPQGWDWKRSLVDIATFNIIDAGDQMAGLPQGYSMEKTQSSAASTYGKVTTNVQASTPSNINTAMDTIDKFLSQSGVQLGMMAAMMTIPTNMQMIWSTGESKTTITTIGKTTQETNFAAEAAVAKGGGTYVAKGGELLIINPQNDLALQKYLSSLEEYVNVTRTSLTIRRADLVNDYIHNTINYNQTTKDIIYQQSGGKAWLGQFAEECVGVCREMSALTHTGLAQVGKESEIVTGVLGTGGRHAWVEFIDTVTGQKMVADPTWGFVTTAEQAYSQYGGVYDTIRRIFVTP